jgi:hypothetical protein
MVERFMASASWFAAAMLLPYADCLLLAEAS